MKTVYSSCRICTASCGFSFEVENNQITHFSADFDHPVSQGHCCPKGISGIERQQGKGDRLLVSRKKQSDGSFETIDTLAAAKEVGAKLKAIIDEHGSRSVALFFGTGAYANTLGASFSRAWLHATGSPNYFTTVTIDQSSHWITMGRMGVFLGGMPDLDDIDVGLISGANPLVSHLGWPSVPVASMNPGEQVRSARANGQKLIVVDPRRTETARSADLHLQLIPGEDATLYAGIIHLLFACNGINQSFCQRYVTHVDRLKQLVTPFTPEYVSQRTGVPEENLHKATEWLANARRPAVGCCTGTAMAPDSNLADFLLVCINALCGGFRQAGDRVRNQAPLAGISPIADVVPPNRTWEQEPKCRTQDVGHILGEFPSALIPDEILVPGKDKIRAMVVFGGNPVIALVDPEKTTKAFNDLDLLVTLDVAETETTALSDYTLAVSTQYERHDLSAFNVAFPKPYEEYYQPVIEKPGSVAHDWEIFWTMAQAMDLPLELKFTFPGVPFKDSALIESVNMEAKPDPEDLIRKIFESRNIDFETLKNAPRGTDFGLGEAVVAAPQEDSGARLDVCPDDVAEDIQKLWQSKAVESRYRLAVRRMISVQNSAYRRSDFNQKKFPLNYAYMNPEDMLAEGLSDGARIDMWTDSGKIVGTVRSDDTVRAGVVSMTHCFGELNPENDPEGALGGFTGRLIPLDPNKAEAINFMPHKTGIPVNIELRQ